MVNNDFVQARRRMVEYQIAARGVNDPRVLEAMAEVPRHFFVPASFQHQAYEDHPLPIGRGQTISQPYIVAAMTEALKLENAHRVLEIGTGSGYQTALLAWLAGSVYTVELVDELSKQARLAAQRLDLRNVRFRVGDGNAGWPEFAPYDRIIVTAAAEMMPFALVEQLADGGRIVVPVGREAQTLTVGVKHGRRLVQRALMSVVFVPFVKPGARADDVD
ncbi:protein-L-isoaspartate(D-aspartate) O-methyltransferase [candidate division WOR-3 bacterium]|nr:protein-L-isoaspartate(D-aspartate) O-methyltransferase [candidate division WOR-3 bacterium]